MQEIDAVNASHLTKRYQQVPVVEDITIRIPDNRIVGLIGRNGSGKTTFMKMCAGLLDSTEGELKIWGEEPMDNIRVLSNVVYTCHDILYPANLVLMQILKNYQVSFPEFDLEFALGLLHYFELSRKMKYIQLSKGMAGIFNFICALSCRAKFTMFDEPVLGMDAAVRKMVYEVLLRDYLEHPRTILISSHLLSEIEGVLSEIILINHGRLVLYEDIDDLRQSACRIDGDRDTITGYAADKQVIYRKDQEIGSTAVIYHQSFKDIEQDAALLGFKASSVRVEDLCLYLTHENKEVELECLWKKANG